MTTALPLPFPEAVALPATGRQWRAAAMLGWPLALGTAPLLLSLGDLPLCAFRLWTGRPCPLCGGTHACAALAEGNFLAAWQASPGLMPLFLLAALQTVQWGYEAVSGRQSTRWRVGPALWQAGGVFLLSTWLLRLFGLSS